jgi:hypothetical protein
MKLDFKSKPFRKPTFHWCRKTLSPNPTLLYLESSDGSPRAYSFNMPIQLQVGQNGLENYLSKLTRTGNYLTFEGKYFFAYLTLSISTKLRCLKYVSS